MIKFILGLIIGFDLGIIFLGIVIGGRTDDKTIK